MFFISPENLACLYTVMSASSLSFLCSLLFLSLPPPFLLLLLLVDCCLSPPPSLLRPLSLPPPLPILLPSSPLPLLSPLPPQLCCCRCTGFRVAPPSCPFVAPAGCCQLLCLCCWHLLNASLFWTIDVYPQSGMAEDDNAYHQSGAAEDNTPYPHGNEAKEDVAYRHPTKDGAAYCLGGTVDKDAG